MDSNWDSGSGSQFEWERSALDFVRARLPEHAPYRAWANFEFQTPDGAIYEVDLLVVTKVGFWFVEIKSNPGKLEGDTHNWTWTHQKKAKTVENPLFLANRKAKALISLLKSQPSVRSAKKPLPFLEPLIFLSGNIDCKITGTARNRLCERDRDDNSDSSLPGIMGTMTNRESWRESGIKPITDVRSIDSYTSSLIAKAMKEAGISARRNQKKVGDILLKEILDENPKVSQDWLGEQQAFGSLSNEEAIQRRVRVFLVSKAIDEAGRKQLNRAAERELTLLQGLDHPNILQVRDWKQSDFGPALIFKHYPNSSRLDRFLAVKGSRLSIDQRLSLVKQIAEGMRYAHSRSIYHRGLSPQSILVVEHDDGYLEVKIYNWQVGAYEEGQGNTSLATSHVGDLVEHGSLVYLAPETTRNPQSYDGISDIFSLGVLAYHIMTGRRPATTERELWTTLQRDGGLRIEKHLDSTIPALEELIYFATQPKVLERYASVEEFIHQLESVEEELTQPDTENFVSPEQAKPGDRLEGGFEVVKQLGRGSTAVAIQAKRDNTEYVLKIARDEEHNDRVNEEGQVLQKLRSEYVVECFEITSIDGRTTLVLESGGGKTLGSVIRENGRLTLDLLERYGIDLLKALEFLEDEVVSHRDIKPDNLAIRTRDKKKHKLMLFDFSLSSAPPSNIRVGTRAYIDPFISRADPPRWTTSSERFSAAVTLHEMATGVLPKWGDGASHPEFDADGTVRVDQDLFDSAIRKDLKTFFEKALSPERHDRFESAEEMRRAWERIFHPITITEHEAQASTPLPSEFAPTTPIAALGFSAQAQSALDRANIYSAADLIRANPGSLIFMRGVGNTVRKEIRDKIEEIKSAIGANQQSFLETEPVKKSQPEQSLFSELEILARRVADGNSHKIKLPQGGALFDISLYPGIDGRSETPKEWPTQGQLAKAAGCTAAKISQLYKVDRARISEIKELSRLRQEIVEKIAEDGGATTLAELIDWVVAAKGSSVDDDIERQHSLASGLIRAAHEAELARKGAHGEGQRFVIKRTRDNDISVVFAINEQYGRWAAILGQAADELVKTGRNILAFEALANKLRQITPPNSPSALDVKEIDDERLARLSAAMATKAALSAKGELYPKDLEPSRTLRMTLGSLLGLGREQKSSQSRIKFDDKEIRRRVQLRYPESTPIPGRPELDSILMNAGLDLEWDDQLCEYHWVEPPMTTVVAETVWPKATAHAKPFRILDSEDKIVAKEFEETLSGRLKSGGFTALAADQGGINGCIEQFSRRFPSVNIISIDRLLVKTMNQLATEKKAKWEAFLKADAQGKNGKNWNRVTALVDAALDAIGKDVLENKSPILLVEPGLLARYDRKKLISQAYEAAGKKECVPAVLLLTVNDHQNDGVWIDSMEIPIVSKSERLVVPKSWIENRHRA